MGHDIKLAESFVMRGKERAFTDILSMEVEVKEIETHK